MALALVWLRDDLRLDDQPALRAAFRQGYAPLPAYVHAPEEAGDWAPGAASQAWRARSLAALDAELRTRGSRLIVLRGPSLDALVALAAATGAEAAFWCRGYDTPAEAHDAAVARALRARGLRVEVFNGSQLVEPWDIATRHGDPYRVFTPFWSNARDALRLPSAWRAPACWPAPPAHVDGIGLEALGQPRAGWDGSAAHWTPGEGGAHAALRRFIERALDGYTEGRDRPAQPGTSRLSPHLHFGEIAPWRVVAEVQAAHTPANAGHVDAFLRQLFWREFACHVLHHFPHSVERNLDPRFDAFPWAAADESALAAWRAGRTGVPIVDAGMRELQHTGWMHNRVRMIVASYLTKHMRMHWREGARWFLETLVDADTANNTLGWQWVAGTGADAAPYFRIFNPVTQACTFDPDGAYIARWLPELAALPVPLRFAPWQDPVRLRHVAPDYPSRPLVDLAAGRAAALAAFHSTVGARR
ncbi:MAG TPA: deoxyribodipyrimidine photo-lyase [Lysobacter sp.]|nr:deoxyribodipyrimidine photo-lyase [Lysobacter sp.]